MKQSDVIIRHGFRCLHPETDAKLRRSLGLDLESWLNDFHRRLQVHRTKHDGIILSFENRRMLALAMQYPYLMGILRRIETTMASFPKIKVQDQDGQVYKLL